MKDVNEYTCEFRKWYYDAFDSNMNMTILANTYYEKLSRKLSNYFQEEYEKIRTKDVDTVGINDIQCHLLLEESKGQEVQRLACQTLVS